MAATNNNPGKGKKITQPVSYSQMVAKQIKSGRRMKALLIAIFVMAVGGVLVSTNLVKIPDIALGTYKLSFGNKDQASLASEATISFTSNGIIPSAITVGPETQITWTNNDTVDHTIVFPDNDDLNSELLKPGDTFSLTIESAGTYTFKDPAHANVAGTIFVE